MRVSYTNGRSEVISRTTWTTNGTTGVTSPESTIFFLYDHSANVNAIVDEDGALLRRIDYDVFGAERATGWDSGISNANASSNRMKFSGAVGHVGEPDAGLIYMRARYYDPSLGRFISEDPAQSGTNWYAYCGNNPVNMVDRSGCEPGPMSAVAWYTAGAAFLAAAELCLFVPWAGKGGGGLKMVGIAEASILTVSAVICFGNSAVGLDMTANHQYAMNVLSNVANYLPAIATLTASVKNLTSKGIAGGIASAAIGAAFAQQVILYGYIASIGADA